MNRIYFDNAATTPIAAEVISSMADAMKNYPGNPSSIHKEGRESRAAIERARKKVAQLMGSSIGEIFFTSCGTESNNMILRGCVRDLEVKRIISSQIEHHAVLHPLHKLEKEGVEVIYLDLDERGRISIAQLEEVLKASDENTLVSLMHANNEVGTMIDLE
ncbi:MAG: aminotransferase class V-fold PLP-dependent enzyme, partial [Bacteroidota bacterium]